MASTEPKVFRTDRKQRLGKGFSREEIKKADSNPAEALRFGLRVDSKRKTAHEENVEALKAYLTGKKAAAKARAAAKPKSGAKPKVAVKPKIAAKPKTTAKAGRKTKS